MQAKQELFETKSVPRAILELALPAIAGQIILVIYAMADTFFVARTGSSAAITAVTVCTPAFMFLSAISNLFGVGGAGVISRALGKREYDRVRLASSFAFWGCALTTLIYSLLAFALSDTFIDLLGGHDAAVHAFARRYLICTVVIGGEAAALGTLFSHLVRSNGLSLLAGIGTALGGVCNIILDPVFMFSILPRGSEVTGAAIATALSNCITLIYFVILLIAKRGTIVMSFLPHRQMLTGRIPRDILTTGLPACIMTLFENISFAVLDYILSLESVVIQAGIGVAKKVNMLAHSMVRGMAQGVLPLIGYNYSSGNHRRMKAVVLTSASASVVLAFACTAICLLFSRQLISVFLPLDSPSLPYGAAFLRILCAGAPFSACAYAFISFFQGVGRGGRSCVLAVMRKGVLDIPLMALLSRLITVYGSVWATPLTDFICCAAALILFFIFLKKHTNILSDDIPAQPEREPG